MAAAQSAIIAAFDLAAAYTAGHIRLLERLCDAFDEMRRWAARQVGRPRARSRGKRCCAWGVLLFGVFLMLFVAPIATFRDLRQIVAGQLYLRNLPREVTDAAVAVVDAHRTEDAERFTHLSLRVFPGGSCDLTNVGLLSFDEQPVYLGLGSICSTGLGRNVDLVALERTTHDLKAALVALQPPHGRLDIPLRRG